MEETKTLIPSKFRSYMVLYSDIVIRSLIAFVFSFLVFSIIGVGILHISFIIVLVVAFLFGVLITPFLSKISLGGKFINWYEGILSGVVKRTEKFAEGKGEYK